jgi:hypothetical protein
MRTPSLRLGGRSLISLAVASSLALSQTGCLLSTTEVVNTDRIYLLGPKTESEPGPATRDITIRAVDTKGTLAFHVDRARECTVTSTPRYQKVHIEGRQGKNIAGGIVTGSILTAAAAGLIVGSFFVDGGEWTKPSSSGTSDKDFTGAGLMGLGGIIVGIAGLVILPRGLYHAAISGTEVTPGEVQVGQPPPGAVRAPEGYDPKKPVVGALAPRLSRPQHDVFALGTKPASEIEGIPSWARVTASSAASAPEPVESLRSARAFDEVARSMDADACDAASDPALLAIPQTGGGSSSASDQMKACVTKHTPSCQNKCGSNKACVLECLRKPCVENLEAEASGGSSDGLDEYKDVITKKEVCERSADTGLAITLVTVDYDGVPRTIDLGKTDKEGNIQKNVLAGLEGVYPGWPEVKQVIMPEARVVLVEDPAVELGKVDLNKYPDLKYAEHVNATRKAREAVAAAEAARKEKEARERQAMLEAAAKAEDDRLHADERKAEAARKAQQCAGAHQAKCNSECQGVAACVKKCMQKPPVCK